MLSQALTNGCGLLEEIFVDFRKPLCVGIRNINPLVEPVKWNLGRAVAGSLTIQKICKAVRWFGDKLHMLVQPTTASILTAVEENDKILAHGQEKCLGSLQAGFVQRLVLSSVSIAREKHEKWTCVAEFVGNNKMGTAYWTNLKAFGGNIAAISSVTVAFRILMR